MAHYEIPIQVYRELEWKEVKSGALVPGDLIEIPQNVKMPCDAVLT